MYGEYGAATGAAAGIGVFLIIFIIIIPLIGGIFFFIGIYKIAQKAGYPNDKALLYTILMIIPVVNLIIFYFFAGKEDWPVLQELRILRRNSSLDPNLNQQMNKVNTGTQPADSSMYRIDTPPQPANPPQPKMTVRPQTNSFQSGQGRLKCPDCGASLELDARFCPDCGKVVTSVNQSPSIKKCANCGAENSPDAKFCRNCGKPLA